jgi:hypothetical protein
MVPPTYRALAVEEHSLIPKQRRMQEWLVQCVAVKKYRCSMSALAAAKEYSIK